MPLGVRIFLAYFLFVGLTAWFVLSTVMDEIRPGVRQSTEETLVDTANLLAEILKEPVKHGTLGQSPLEEQLRGYGQRRLSADIWGVQKQDVDHRIYVTDRHGIVLLDSSGEAVGQDYSRWNDVYLTLRGEYGARSTPENPDDPDSTVMYVAAPIIDDGRIIGVVTVAKPNSSLQPYIDRSQRRLTWLGGGLVLLGLIVGGLLSWWLSAALAGLTHYARTVSEGRRAELPRYRGGELQELAAAIERMRAQLEGKDYVERYVQTLTHELKTPLAAIRGAAELLSENELQENESQKNELQQDESQKHASPRAGMPAEQRRRFIDNIDRESGRLQQLVERLLNLAQVEQRQGLEETVAVPLRELVDDVVHSVAGRAGAAGLVIENTVAAGLALMGERFLLRQALANLVDNAIDFTPARGSITIAAEPDNGWLTVRVHNQGEPVPDYALPRLTERFYSLPRPGTGRKSTGLGLNFVEEVAGLHGGRLAVVNCENGVEARLTLPAAQGGSSPR